jgi:hypothetical protein
VKQPEAALRGVDRERGGSILKLCFKGSGVELPRYPVTVTGDGFVKDSHWPLAGKADENGLIRKPGNFGIPFIFIF